jgi:dihydrofolate reductase
MRPMKTIIVAYDRLHGIGANNDLLWMGDMPADLQHFRDTTTDSVVIMGHNTFNSIGRPLPNRKNIIISRSNEAIDGCLVVNSLQSAYDAVGPNQDVYVIGGGSIYAMSIDTVDRIIATEIDAVFDKATIFFPEIDRTKWHETSRVKHKADENNLYDYDFVIYERI